MYFPKLFQSTFFPYRPLYVNFLPCPFALHIFTIAVLITACALGHMHDILTWTCSPLTFIMTCCSENVPWWTSCAFFPPFCFFPGYPHRSSIHSDFIRWMRKCFVWLSVGILCVVRDWFWASGFLWPPQHVLRRLFLIVQHTYCPAEGTGLVKYHNRNIRDWQGTVWSQQRTQRVSSVSGLMIIVWPLYGNVEM